MSNKPHKLSVDLQADFFARLNALRDHFLGEALKAAVSDTPLDSVDSELGRMVKPAALKLLAAGGLRGELFFAVPCLLKVKPSLLGYYRLLYGFSQKEFYSKGPYGRFKGMEERGNLSKNNEQELPVLCAEMNSLGEQLLAKIGAPKTSTFHELQILTLGPQFRGGQNTQLGQIATQEVFGLIRKLVKPYIKKETGKKLELVNSLGRKVVIEFSSDPDIKIVQIVDGKERPVVSVEIKGGADVSNVHNRLGEAEKSHQKAKARGFSQFWTISRAGTSIQKAKEESPTTNHFFDLDSLLLNSGGKYKEFVLELSTTLGIR